MAETKQGLKDWQKDTLKALGEKGRSPDELAGDLKLSISTVNQRLAALLRTKHVQKLKKDGRHQPYGATALGKKALGK